MENQIDILKKDSVFKHFYEICQIPHPSGGEQQLSDSIYLWAKEHGLDVVQDEVYNLFICKPASPGREDDPPVMLQAHLDMVCEKAKGIVHDFEKDSLSWVVDGDLLSTGGKTTLGADDGIGIALALAVLENETLSHPPLEVLFTVSEESDFTGALQFNMKQMKAPYLINLDHSAENEILCGSCGGMEADLEIPLHFLPVPDNWHTWRLSIAGLMGGHSGEDIHRGHGNANILLGRIFEALEKRFPYRIANITGGNYRLAIPREAHADICLAPEHEDIMHNILSEIGKDFCSELAITGDNLSIAMEPAAAAHQGVDPSIIINSILLVPDGIFQMNEALPGLVDTSDNLGELYLNENGFHMVFEIRSARESLRDYLYVKIERLADLLGGTCSFSHEYPSWDFHPDSKLRDLAIDIYQKLYAKKPSILTVHAGLEVGCFFEKNSAIDAISIGPNCWNFHSPSETVSISSVQRTCQFLYEILENIH